MSICIGHLKFLLIIVICTLHICGHCIHGYTGRVEYEKIIQ